VRFLGVSFLVFLVTAPTANAARFSYGVAAGEVTATSALLWARPGAAGPVTLEVLRGGRVVQRRRAVAQREHDLTVRVPARGLRPATRYSYRFRQGRSLSARGSFRTAPARDRAATVRFAISGDADATPGPNGPFFNRFETYAQMASKGNDFNVNLGDTIYSDSGVGGAPVARTVAQKWAKYRQNLALAPLRSLRGATGVYNHWDDHEFINDFSRAEHGDEIYRAGRAAFLDYMPATAGSLGLYRTFRWGRNVELFFLDERSFRSGKASANGVCGTPPDLAPTAPSAVRAAFAALARPLARPVPAGCKETIDDAARTMLGSAQLARFARDLRASTATWKIVMNEVPLQQFYANPYDRWEGYAAERAAVLDLIAAVPNAVVLATDHHANLIGELRYQTLEPPGPRGTGVIEVATGPVATNTYAREVDATLGATGVGQAVASFFYKPPPPRGIGMRCAAIDAYSYAEVRVTANELRVDVKDAEGEPVRDVDGTPCAPVVLTARSARPARS
jgi:phosphodiesterase/alkaline phosphatase D-like protein